MRLAHLSPYTSPVVGGISSYTRELAETYQSMGVECLGLAVSGTTNRHFRVLGPRRLPFILRALHRLLRWKPGVVHSHSHWHVLFPGIVMKLLRPGTRVLFTFHTEPQESRRGFSRVAMAVLLHFCDGVAFVSQSLKDLVDLPESIPQAVVHAAPERKTRLIHDSAVRERRLAVLFVGPLVWPKKVAGVLMLLDAFASISTSFPDWRLVIVGDGPLRPRVQEKVSELGLGNVVDMTGSLDDATQEIGTVEVYAQISLQEGLPLSLLNAMALETPIVATAIGGIPEVIVHERTGYLVEPRKEAVVEGLSKLMRDPMLRKALAAEAKKWVATELTWERVAMEHLRLVSRGLT